MKGIFHDKNILIISPEPWSENHVSKHHYAIELAKQGNSVFYLNPPKTSGATLFQALGNQTNLKIINYTSGIMGLRFFPRFLARILMTWEVAKLQSICGVQFDIVWSFDNSRFFDLEAFGKNILKIAHIMDFNMDFQLEPHAQSADICFGVTQGIVNKLLRANSNSHFINHGFAGGADSQQNLDGKVRAVYTGNLLIPYLNWDLIKKLVQGNRDVEFTFLGNFQRDKLTPEGLRDNIDWLNSQENCKLMGQVAATSLESHYANADILLLFYDHIRHPKQVANSHKILEYLGSGKVVMANFTKEYEGLELLLMSDSDEEYLELFSKVKIDIEKYNDEEQMKRRMDFANANSYMRQLERIETLIVQSNKI